MIPPHQRVRRSATICYDTTDSSLASLQRRSSSTQNLEPKPYYQHLTNTGSEPGVDVKRDAAEYAHLTKPTRITVVDYNSDGHGSRVDVPGAQLEDWLKGDDGQRPSVGIKDEKTPGKSVRWINVDGINFETIRILALQYNLHPLAVEDALRASNNPRSKIDFYTNHLYSQVVVQHMRPHDQELLKDVAELSPEELRIMTAHPVKGWRKLFERAKGKGKTQLPEGVEGVFEPVSPNSDAPDYGPPTSTAHRMTIDQLSAKYMIPLRRTVLSIFMLRDGTLITMCANPFSGLMMPIYKRLEDQQGIMRQTADASMLLQGLLDVVVDIAIEITKAFEQEILKMEAGCLIHAEMETVRHLHVISSQLVRLKRHWMPLQRVLYTLRDQESIRAAASSIGGMSMAGTGNGMGSSFMPTNGTNTPMEGGHHAHELSLSVPLPFNSAFTQQKPFNAQQATGYISNTTKVYLSDVIDHLDSVLTSVSQFVGTCEHLTDYIFNMLSFFTNASMERLSLVTVIFLPLTFLVGYFGQNFKIFDALDNSVMYFWQIALPVTVGFFFIFCSGYIANIIRIISRKISRKRRESVLQKRMKGGRPATRVGMRDRERTEM